MGLLNDLELALAAVFGNRLRSALSALGIALGVASVVLLTSIGEGAHQYVLAQFTQFGANILEVTPGTTETVGIPGVLGGSTRKLTIDDAIAIGRLPAVERSMAFAFGQAEVEAGERGRSVYVYGGTSDLPDIWKFGVRQGRFLPEGDPHRGASVAVLGPTLKRELFDDANALGRFVRVGGTRFRVIGVMEPKGRLLGFDMDDAVYVPLASALQLFNLEEVWEIQVTFAESYPVDRIEEDIRNLLIGRHGDEDFTITTQNAMLDVLNGVMGVITFAVAGIAGISLLVGAVGILTMTWIAVGERTPEIGLMRALGATRAQVLRMFLTEAAVLATIGGLVGIGSGVLLAHFLELIVPGLPVEIPFVYAGAGLVTSVVTGILSGTAPARRAARLEPIDALRAE